MAVRADPRFLDRVVVVTGAAGGLGRAYASGFAAEGAHVVVADIAADGARETVDLILRAGGSAEAVTIDMGDEAALHAAAAGIAERHPRIDVLVNNAGVAYGEVSETFETLSQAKWLHFLAVNSVGPLLLAQALRRNLAAAGGVVLNQSSMASFSPTMAYSVTKATLNAMTYGMAQAFASDGIRVVAIAPGLVETPASRAGLSADNYAHVQSRQLLPLEGTSAHIVALALFLASEDAAFINCEIVSADGGSSLRGWRY